MVKITLVLSALFALSSCSSVMQIASAPAVPAGQCQVRVFLSKDQALKLGEIEELCVISGSSSGSFVHTPEVAINKHKTKACQCGGTNVYVRSESPGGLGVATASMVAFRYVEE